MTYTPDDPDGALTRYAASYRKLEQEGLVVGTENPWAEVERQTIKLGAITGTLLHRAWLKSGRPDPLMDADGWDGFALTVQALAEMERITRGPSRCDCGEFVPDSSGDAGCGNCGADEPPLSGWLP